MAIYWQGQIQKKYTLHFPHLNDKHTQLQAHTLLTRKQTWTEFPETMAAQEPSEKLWIQSDLEF